MKRLRELWNERARREQLIILVGAVVVGIGIAYAYLWLPIVQQRERLAAEVPRLRAEAQQMRADAPEVARLRATAKSAPANLSATLASFAAGPRFAGLTPQLSAEANGRVRVSFASVSADVWFAWIAALSLEHGVRVESARLEMLDKAGVVKATATLAAGGQ